MIGSLTARIFAIFWLTLALVLMLVLMLPKLDSRQMTELLDSEQRQGLMIECGGVACSVRSTSGRRQDSGYCL